MTIRASISIALRGCALSVLTLVSSAHAAEIAVSNNVDADTWITFESDVAERADEINGANESLLVRSGNGSLAQAVRKPLIRFDITGATIDPTLVYLLEVTTAFDGTSSSTHVVSAITDSALQSFDEATLTWNNAPASATASRFNFNDAGTEAEFVFGTRFLQAQRSPSQC